MYKHVILLFIGIHLVLCAYVSGAASMPPVCYDELPPGSDFKINDDTTFSTDWEKYPAVFVDGFGRTVVTWSAVDFSSGETKVLCQRLDEHNSPLGCAVRVDDDTLTPACYSTAHYNNPQIAGNGSGEFVLVWGASQPHSYFVAYSLVFQLFGPDGLPIGENVVVNRTTTDYFWSHWPSVAMAPSGEFVIAWHDDQGDVYASRFFADGSPNGPNILVNSDVDWTGNWMPSLAMDRHGGFIVAWRRSDSTSIGLRRFDNGGIPVGPTRQFGPLGHFPSVGCDSTGAGVVVWTEPVPGYVRLLSQRFDSLGVLVDSNSLIAELDSNVANRYPSVAVREDGGYAVAWSQGTSGNHDIVIRHFDASGLPVDSGRVVNDVTIKEQYYPSITAGHDGREAIAWEDERTYHGRPDIYLQRLDSAGYPEGGNLLINRGETHQYYPSVSMGATGKGIVVWQDARYRDQTLATSTHVYYQCIDPNGVSEGPNQDLGPGSDGYVAMAPSDESIVVWNTSGVVYCQQIDKTGMPGARLSVAGGYSPKVVRSGQNWVVAWTYYGTGGDYDIHAGMLDSLGQPLGGSMRIDDGPDGNQVLHSMAGSLDGSFWAGWLDRREGGCSVYLRRFDTAAQALGGGVRLNDNAQTAEIRGPYIGAEYAGSVLACWLDSRDGVWNIYAQRVNSTGELVGGNFKVNHLAGVPLNSWSVGVPDYWHPVIGTTPTGVSLIAWPTFGADSTDEDIWAQWIDASGNAIGQNFKLPDAAFDAALQRAPALAVGENSALAVWMDDRRGTGLDIFGGYLELQSTDVDGESERSMPSSFVLSQNYPNPFNPVTTIEYTISIRSQVRIEIYNVLGQLVRTLVDENKPAGQYRIEWDGLSDEGKSVSTGVYLYRFQTGEMVQTKKMLLLK